MADHRRVDGRVRGAVLLAGLSLPDLVLIFAPTLIFAAIVAGAAPFIH